MIIALITMGVIEILLVVVAIRLRLQIKELNHRIQIILNDFDMHQFYGK